MQKKLTSTHVWAIAFGCIIGWGAFIFPSKFLPNSGVYGTAIALVLGALVMIVIAYSYAYLIPKYPEAGGEFNFTMNCFGGLPAYFCGWFLVAAYLTNVPMNSTALPLIADGLDGSQNLLKWGFHYRIANNEVWCGEMIFSMLFLFFFGWLNIIGVRKAGIIQTVLVVLLAGSVFILLLSAIISSKTCFANFEPVWGLKESSQIGHTGKLSAILATFAIAPWAYVGFETIPQAVEEFKFPFKKVMTIMMLAIIFGCFVYVANNTVAAAALKKWPDKVIAGEWVLLMAAEEMLGTFGKVLLGIAVLCAVLSSIMGFFLISSRLMYSMARDGYLPKLFSIVDEKYGTPKNALVFCILISLSGPILGREALGWFVDMSAIGASIGFFFTCASTIMTMKRDKDGNLWLKSMAILGCLLSLSFMVLQLLPVNEFQHVHFCQQSYLMLVVWIMIGLIFYIRQKRRII